MAWCEANRVEYLLGLAKTISERDREVKRGRRKHITQVRPDTRLAVSQSSFITLQSWSLGATVVAKAEHLDKERIRGSGDLSESRIMPAQALYEEHYCARGDWRSD